MSGSFRNRYEQELFRNTGQFPLANLLLELLLEGPAIFLAPDVYTLIGATLLQTWALTRWENTPAPRRFLGNLIGPATYTLIEALLEGWKFFDMPNHIAYWIFAIAVGVLQAARLRAGPGAAAGVLVVLENVVRAAILFVMYAVFELLSTGTQFAAAAFFADRSHLFIALATLILGLSVGLATLSEYGFLALLRETSTQLQRYSEWLLGKDLLERVIANPEALTMVRRERAILFMDIRGFTSWSERCSPESVVQALNSYYQCAEPVAWRHGAIKLKFSADEILAVFPEPRHAAACALELRVQAQQALAQWGLGAGIGVHSGAVVEGLLGSAGIKGYDVIGDTVNTAKRIEGAAGGGEVLVSDSVRAALAPSTPLGPRRELLAKGKEAPLEVYPLL
ncbi:MAG: adenylate/guanylate cyclase domain-containing protein [Burkholderiales bacterium]|nr:adenylate/guanylate cyclase domain-containing protein [Burkholderiales bacterium]